MYKAILLTITLLLSCLCSPTEAQSLIRMGNIVPPPEPVEVTAIAKVNAVEVTTGVAGWENGGAETLFGYGVSGVAQGDLSGSFSMSMNCSPSYWVVGESNSVTGGMWAFPVYGRQRFGFNQVYLGTIYGKIEGGKLAWNDSTADLVMTLTVTGGTLGYEGVSGRGTFNGTLTYAKGESSTDGELTLNYTNAPK